MGTFERVPRRNVSLAARADNCATIHETALSSLIPRVSGFPFIAFIRFFLQTIEEISIEEIDLFFPVVYVRSRVFALWSEQGLANEAPWNEPNSRRRHGNEERNERSKHGDARNARHLVPPSIVPLLLSFHRAQLVEAGNKRERESWARLVHAWNTSLFSPLTHDDDSTTRWEGQRTCFFRFFPTFYPCLGSFCLFVSIVPRSIRRERDRTVMLRVCRVDSTCSSLYTVRIY